MCGEDERGWIMIGFILVSIKVIIFTGKLAIIVCSPSEVGVRGLDLAVFNISV